MRRLWLSRMLYLTHSRHGIFKYRRPIPARLRAVAGIREINRSLDTRDSAEASIRWAKVNLEAESLIAVWEAETAQPGSRAAELERLEGEAFLSQNRLPYVPLSELKARHDAHDEDDGPSELEQRLQLVEDKLGIEVDDHDTRRAAIKASPEARAALGDLSDLEPPEFLMSEALKLYLREKAQDYARELPSAARRKRMLMERVVEYFREAVGEDRAVAKLTHALHDTGNHRPDER